MLETFSYVEARQKQPLTPWGSSVEQHMKRDNVIGVTDVAMMDAGMYSSQNSNRQQYKQLSNCDALLLPQEESVVRSILKSKSDTKNKK